MKQIVQTAEKIMKEAKAYTGWNFLGSVKGNTCTIRADLVNEAGRKMSVTMDIAAGDVLIKVKGFRDFGKKDVEAIYGKLNFPVDAELKEGTSLAISYHEPLGVVEHSLKGVMSQCIVPMTNLIAGMLEE